MLHFVHWYDFVEFVKMNSILFYFCAILLLNYSVDLGLSQGSAPDDKWLTDLKMAILTHRIEKAAEIVQSKQVSTGQWLNIFDEVINPSAPATVEPLVNLGLRLAFSKDKLLYCFLVYDYVASKRESQPKIKEWMQLRNKPKPTDFDAKIRNNAYLNLLKFDEHIIEQWKDQFSQYFSDATYVQANNYLSSIPWERLANVELSSYTLDQDAVLLVHFAARQALLNNYANTNINLYLDRAESINNEVFKTVVLGALYHGMHEKENNNHPQLFKLAYALKKHFGVVQHTTRDISKRKTHLHRYVDGLLKSFDGCVKNIVLEPENNGYLVTSKKYGEYLYPVASALGVTYKTSPTDVDKSTYRAIFTYIPKVIGNNQGKWTLQFENDHFWLRNGYFPDTYLGTSSTQAIHGRSYEKPELKDAVRIIPAASDSNSCYIENYLTHRRIYAGGDDKLEDKDRRVVLIGQENAGTDDSYLWTFSTFKLN